jgi:hypothetical protein
LSLTRQKLPCSGPSGASSSPLRTVPDVDDLALDLLGLRSLLVFSWSVYPEG